MTLYGNKKQLAFEIFPVAPTWERRYEPEQAAWGGLAIWADDQNLCRHIWPGSDQIHNMLYVPLAPLADWLVQSWPAISFEERARDYGTSRSVFRDLCGWGERKPPADVSEDDWVDAREAWWSRHFLLAGAEGAQLPNLALQRNDDTLLLAWEPARFVSDRAPTFMLPPGSVAVSWEEAEIAVRAFVNGVLEVLEQAGLQNVYPWLAAKDPLAAAGSQLLRLALYTARSEAELRALTGCDADDDISRRLGLVAPTVDPGSSPVTQILRDLPPGCASPDLGEFLLDLDQQVRAPAGSTRTALRGLARDAARAGQKPEQAGQLAATFVRRHKGFEDRPIRDLDAFLESCEVSTRDPGIKIAGTRMISGYREAGSAIAVILQDPRTGTEWGRRFEQARALGHLLLDPHRGGAVGAAASPFAQDTRRRRSGAFAAELLLPEAALRSASEGGLDRAAEPAQFRALLEDYRVGARTAAHQLWNHGCLSSRDVRDDLIDAFTDHSPSP